MPAPWLPGFLALTSADGGSASGVRRPSVKLYDKSGDAADSALLNICPLEFRRRAISVFATGTSLFARLRKRRVVSGGSCVARRFQIKLAVRFTYVQYSTLECAGAGVFTFWVRLAPLARSHNRRL
jgi:hypothetical protein